jgi:hypothetical protein
MTVLDRDVEAFGRIAEPDRIDRDAEPLGLRQRVVPLREPAVGRDDDRLDVPIAGAVGDRR